MYNDPDSVDTEATMTTNNIHNIQFSSKPCHFQMGQVLRAEVAEMERLDEDGITIAGGIVLY